MRFLLIFLSGLCLDAADCEYSLVIRGGHVIDPANSIDGVRDVAIQNGKIARVAGSIPVAAGCAVAEAKGLYVTPGLVDIHAHVYTNTGIIGQLTGDTSLIPDAVAPRSGVTTLVDAGTSGWRNFEDFKKRIIDRSQTRVLALLNIAALGMGGKNEQDTADMDAAQLTAMAKRYPQIIVGVKTAHYAAPDWIAVDRAIAAAAGAKVPVMIDFGTHHPATRPIEDLLLKKLRPGDIYTHLYSGLRNELLANGKVNPALFEARKRGVILDMGHGNGSFFWAVATAGFAQGLMPDVISTDLHLRSWMMGMKDMNNCMSKALNLGMSLQEVIRRSTVAAAKAIQRPELGTLSVGAEADVAVLRLETGSFGFLDSRMERRQFSKRLSTELTLRAGKAVYDLNGLAAKEWVPSQPHAPAIP